MRRLAERGVGFATAVRPVPIVPAAILFDLGVGDPDAYPTADAGAAATVAAESNDGPLEGAVGAGSGATVAKLGGVEQASPGGVGSAARRLADGHLVGALVVNNALGDVYAPRRQPPRGPSRRTRRSRPRRGTPRSSWSATDASLDRAQARKLAELGHDALARGIRPAHTMFDGDVVFALSSGEGTPADPEALLQIGMAADDAIGEAIERSVAG